MLNPTYSTALLLAAAVLALVAITPRMGPHAELTMQPLNKASATACIRQMPQYRPNPANKC
jgi:hypothetical protein